MSKSVGNVVSPHLLVDAYGPDAVRYFLLREVAFGADGEFAHAAFLTRYNADLANDLGNLAHRTLTMTEKWLGGKIGPAGPQLGGDEALWALAERATRTFDQQLRKLQFRDALDGLWELVRAGNKYLDSEGPWTLNKEGRLDRLGTVLRNTVEICRIAGSHLACVCPGKSMELLAKLGENAPTLSPRLDHLPAGREIQSGEPLFPRLMDLPDSIKATLEAAGLSSNAATPAARIQRTEKSVPKEQKPKKEPPVSTESPAPVAPATPAVAGPADITYEDFAKLQLRVAKVVGAERHPNADRLLVLKVDVGEAEPRTIVAGIAAVYKPEELVGQQVVVVANLKPAKLRGVMSQGMLLAAGGPDVAALVRPQQELPPGTVVK